MEAPLERKGRSRTRSRSRSRAERALSPLGRLLLHPNCYTLIHLTITTADPIHIPRLKAHLSTSIFATHPRFTTVPDTGSNHWPDPDTAAVIDPDRHVITVNGPVTSVNDYLAELASVCAPLPTDKPLWEIHVLPEPHSNCAIFVIHHALGDGACVMSLLESFCSPTNEPQITPKQDIVIQIRERGRTAAEVVKTVWFTMVSTVKVLTLFLGEKGVKIVAKTGVNLHPRNKFAIAAATFSLEDMKMVKNAISPPATINDVFIGIISCGLSRYVHLLHSQQDLKGLKFSGFAAVNMRPGKKNPAITDLKGWGNKLGCYFNRIYYKDPSDSRYDAMYHLKNAKLMMDRSKLSLESRLYRSVINTQISCFGPQLSALSTNRFTRNSTFISSNIVGPSKEIAMVGNPITSVRVNIASKSSQALMIHMVSYAGKAELQILAEREAIPDPQILTNFFEEALHQMKSAVPTKGGRH
uniref:Diacylglycerol O-acyltransferase n=1 Tax=Kalanchoe fedtschenkoi TaxID=63787 RepID=A0A7N0VK87_KALFE